MRRGKRLLAVSWCMPPGLFPRSIQVARLLKGLKRLGWTSSVITPSPLSRAGSDPIDEELVRTYADHYDTVLTDLSRVDPEYGPLLPRWQQRWSGEVELTRDQLWIKRASERARHFIRHHRADVLVSFAQPWSDHRIGLAIAEWQPALPWVAHFSDPWVDSLYEADQPAEVQQQDRAIEARVIERASAVVFTNQYAADLVMAKYPAALGQKAHVVPHTMDTELLANAGLARPNGTGARPLRLSHVGNLFAGRRRANALFEALATLNVRRPLAGRLELILLGEGSGLYEARGKVFELSLEPIVTFRQRVPHLESLAAMAASDVLVLIDAPSETNVFMPSKVVDYLMADRPILALTPKAGSTAEIMAQLGYPTVDPQDVAQIVAAIEQLLRRHDAGELHPDLHPTTQSPRGGAPGLAPSPNGAAYLRRFALEETSRAFDAILTETLKVPQ